MQMFSGFSAMAGTAMSPTRIRTAQSSEVILFNVFFILFLLMIWLREPESFAAADDAVRAAYFEDYLSQAKANGIKCFVWDNGVSKGKSSFGIVRRGSLQWNQTLLDGIMKGSES